MEPSGGNHRESPTDTIVPGMVYWIPEDTLRQQLLIRCLARMVRHALETEEPSGPNGGDGSEEGQDARGKGQDAGGER